jgi:hypothetical protein
MDEKFFGLCLGHMKCARNFGPGKWTCQSAMAYDDARSERSEHTTTSQILDAAHVSGPSMSTQC